MGRPQQSVGFQDAYSTLAAKAAALTHSLILGHAFHDANKRTGMLAGVVFMDVNGCELVTDQGNLYEIALAVEDKRVDLAALTDWFDNEDNVLPLTEDEWEQVQVMELSDRLLADRDNGQ